MPLGIEYDRSSKFAHYRSIPGLQDYLLVDCEAVSVEHFHRLKRDEWLLRVYSRLDDVLVLDALGISLSLSEFYDLAEG
jgi:Uma2 family endonuclease